jgi:UDP-3-O-[3-hydroxymyristoyl] N-acetylglucosamine deacetylase
MRLLPAEPGTGIVFRRVDRREPSEIAANWRHVTAAPLCTMLRNGAGAEVRTVEHLMCAIYACAIDNVIVELDGPEVPILDGSAAPLVALIESAGAIEQAAPRRFLRILKPVAIADGKSRITLAPGPGFAADVTLIMPDFGVLRWSGEAAPAIVRNEIAPARTFGRLKEALPGIIAGRIGRIPLLRGASLRSAVVVHRHWVLNRGGLRFPDEFVRHRVLDAIGDLALAGGPLLGRFTAMRTAHRFNHRILAALFSDETAWCWSSAPLASAAPSAW